MSVPARFATIALQLKGLTDEMRLPALLSAGGPSVDPFLPPGYLVATGAFDVGIAARRGDEAETSHRHVVREDELLLLELADGSTFITAAARLQASLRAARPDLLGSDGSILLEKLRAEGATGKRGLFGDALGTLVSKVYTFLAGEAEDAIVQAARERLGDAAGIGISWAGARALMWAIEQRLDRPCGLYRWSSANDLEPLDSPAVWPQSRGAPPSEPMLVFVHGVASSTFGSFGDLRADRELFGHLEQRFRGGIYAFEHRTLSESPIENAIALVNALPQGARLSLVSHSRGGLVADLLCLDDFEALIDAYRYVFEGTGDADADEARRVVAELAQAHAAQRAQLRQLAELLHQRGIVVQRYVRVASPANGTLLASGNFDVFLSSLLTLIGQVRGFLGNPVYSALKRVVIDIAKNRTNPHLVPGIEAMLPDSPLAALLREAPVREGVDMAVIAGDIEGGRLLQRLSVLLTDYLIFESDDNDLVVNTRAMLAGVAPKAGAKVLFDRSADVSHFNYFANIDTRVALRDWLVIEVPERLAAFHALPGPGAYEEALAASRAVDREDRPVVVVLPDMMGSHLKVAGTSEGERVWFDSPNIAAGGLGKIAWGERDVEADQLFAFFYGPLCNALSASHRVERYAYDWRLPLGVLAERFGEYLDRLLGQTLEPVRLLAHGMGGLVVRATIHKRRPVMDRLMARDGARLVMLGTPHQGSHAMVETLLGKGDALRTLARLDLKHDMQQLLDIVAGFRGALQLLPKPGFSDVFQGRPHGGALHDYQSPATWQGFKELVRDPWFGDSRCALPSEEALDEGSWLWRQDGLERPALPAAYEARSIYVFGVARNTPCGVRAEAGRLRVVGTTRGDGKVTWDSGRIGGIGSYYYMPVSHGDLLAAVEHFPALYDLLNSGATARLSRSPSALRPIEETRTLEYDAGPPIAEDPDSLLRALLGSSSRRRLAARPKRRLEVSVNAMDLRFLAKPVMVGHYEQDPISGPEALIDRELLDGALRERHDLGLYAGPRGTAVAVVRAANALERERGSLSGAVVTGLGAYEAGLGLPELTEAVRTGALRYLLQVIDVLGRADREVSLATLLIGYNSSSNLDVAASVEALVRGVMQANARLLETMRVNVRIAKLEIVEIYIDTAIGAVYGMRELAPRLTAEAARQGTTLVCRGELVQGEGSRRRLFETLHTGYWPRLSITDADEGYAPSAAYAERLRFLYVGPRARAEFVVQQRQPGLIEALVRQQVGSALWDEDFGGMLFQLLVPHDLKSVVRHLARVVLVVDAATANVPWELMLADEPARADSERRPFALRTAVVRQLSGSAFRRQVRQPIDDSALVIGNPSVHGSVAAFVNDAGEPVRELPDLPGTQADALAVADYLTGMGYFVQRVIGNACSASDVLAALFRQPWRLLHIAAHGVFRMRHVDGQVRSGVLLSDGMLITAAEIDAMEVVPELLVLNCCHLGQVDAGDTRQVPRESHKLASSLARELIQIGVRCVVVAGWPVDDHGAMVFGRAFYEALLLRHLPFGDAVHCARQAVWQTRPDDITWGAFQAYGEPGWIAVRDAHANRLAEGLPYASVDELLDELAGMRAELSRRSDWLGPGEIRPFAEAIERALERCPPVWRTLPQVLAATGQMWLALGEFGRARAALVAASRSEDSAGSVALRDIQLLANVEARMGEQRNDLRLIDTAIFRLDALDLMVAPPSDGSEGVLPPVANSERSALRASAYKRKAGLFARLLLTPSMTPQQMRMADEQMRTALAASIAAYRSADGGGLGEVEPYLMLNRLALQALLPWASAREQAEAAAQARECGRVAALRFARIPNAWDALAQADALLVAELVEGGLARRSPARKGDADALESLGAAYADVMSGLAIRPVEIDSVVAQIEMLSRFYDALAVLGGSDSNLLRIADRLLELVQRLRPGRLSRTDRPARAAPAALATGPSAKAADKLVPPVKARAKARTRAKTTRQR